MNRPTPRAGSALLPIVLLLVAMASLQGGASLAKTLFPAVGAQGTAALRLGFSALILLPLLRPWRLRLDAAGWRVVVLYGLALGGMNLLFYLSLRTIPHGTRTVALAATVAAAAVLPFGLAHAGAALFSPAIIPLGLAVAILSSALPYALEMQVLTRLPARTFGTLLSLEPVFGALSGLLFLGETLNATQWLAVAAIVAASAGITVTGRRRG